MRVSHGSLRNRSRHLPGFSLIEIVIVLTLIALLAAGGIGIMTLSSSERDLRRASGTIGGMAKRARTIALLQQKSYALEFRPGKVRLLPYAEALADSQDSKRTPGPGNGGDADAPADSILTPVYQETAIEDNTEVLIRRWSTDRWLPMDENHPQVWRFDPDGLCEPITVHVGINGSWIEDEYHPLTAGIRDSTSEIHK